MTHSALLPCFLPSFLKSSSSSLTPHRPIHSPIFWGLFSEAAAQCGRAHSLSFTRGPNFLLRLRPRGQDDEAADEQLRGWKPSCLLFVFARSSLLCSRLISHAPRPRTRRRRGNRQPTTSTEHATTESTKGRRRRMNENERTTDNSVIATTTATSPGPLPSTAQRPRPP